MTKQTYIGDLSCAFASDNGFHDFDDMKKLIEELGGTNIKQMWGGDSRDVEGIYWKESIMFDYVYVGFTGKKEIDKDYPYNEEYTMEMNINEIAGCEPDSFTIMYINIIEDVDKLQENGYYTDIDDFEDYHRNK